MLSFYFNFQEWWSRFQRPWLQTSGPKTTAISPTPTQPRNWRRMTSARWKRTGRAVRRSYRWGCFGCSSPFLLSPLFAARESFRMFYFRVAVCFVWMTSSHLQRLSALASSFWLKSSQQDPRIKRWKKVRNRLSPNDNNNLRVWVYSFVQYMCCTCYRAYPFLVK